jgi:hypothetical protein
MAQAERDSITRRSLFSGALALVPAAAIPAFAAPATPTAPDPIFTAIEAHRRAYAELNAFLHELAAIEQAAWHAPRGKRRAANKRLAEAYKTERRLGDIEHEAIENFVATVPHTLDGAVAALRYVRERYDEGEAMCEEEDWMTLLASIEQAICRAAGLAISPVSAVGRARASPQFRRVG